MPSCQGPANLLHVYCPARAGRLSSKSRIHTVRLCFWNEVEVDLVPMKTFLTVVLTILLCVGSLLNGQSAQQSTAPVARPNGILVQESTYHLSPGDMIEVKIYGEDDLTARVRLNEKGAVDLPLLPGLPIYMLTQGQACEKIRESYMKDFLVDPLVSITILEYSRSKITVLGQVRTPGVYLFPANERLNLLQAIALAGGYTRAGEPSKITIKRAREGKESVIKMDARAMAKDEGYKVFEVEPGDVVTIGESIW